MGVSIGSLVLVAVVLATLFAWLYFDRDTSGVV
jgi:hypothetical protein